MSLKSLLAASLLLCNGWAAERNDVDFDPASPGGCNEIPQAHMYSSSANQHIKEGQTDVYELLWVNNMDVATETWNTPFMLHMQNGDLQSDDYVNFMIQDINYLVKVTAMLKYMSEKVKSPEDLKNFFQGRYKSYNTFAQSILKQFNLKGVEEIEPIPAMDKYLKDYKAIMNQEEPIFFAVSLLPCSRLWLWLANKLNIAPNNAYFDWKKNNMYGHPEEHYKKLLNDHLKTKKDIDTAKNIFRQQMQNEHGFFAASRKA